MAPALLDSNVLVHAANASMPLHREARRLVDEGLKKAGVYCVAPQNLIEFSAVVTRRRFFPSPMAAAEVARMNAILYRSRRLSKIYPQRGTVIRAVQLGESLGLQGPIWYDVFLVGTMLDAGVHRIVSEDQHLRRFPMLTVRSISEEAQ